MRPIDATMVPAIGYREGIERAGKFSCVGHVSTGRGRRRSKAPLPTFEDPAHGVVLLENVAVLFADIVGFTRLAEGVPPASTIDFLRRYHSRMAESVYAHDGAVAQYTGDAIMATFGVPHPGAHNATDALACGFDMLAAIARWNTKRRLRGRFPIEIGIGIHCGAVAVGEIGVERHLEQSISGDTVNVACKLEAMTRTTGTPLIVSHRLVDAVRGESHNCRILAPLIAHGRREVPGRRNQLSIWMLERSAAPRTATRGPARCRPPA